MYDQEDKNIMERAVQYIKDRTECFDDNFHVNITVVRSMLRIGLEDCYVKIDE